MARFPSLNRLRLGRVGLLALLLGTAGCGSGQGVVSGTIRYNGKPLPFGTIQFLGPDGIPRAGQIHSDGTFSVSVPAGPARVIVSCVAQPRPNQLTGPLAGRSGRAAAATLTSGTFALIPQRYADWNASG